jgi:hypothetical protein
MQKPFIAGRDVLEPTKKANTDVREVMVMLPPTSLKVLVILKEIVLP